MKLRVLHCPTSTGGNAWYLSRAERALGIDSDVLIAKSHPFEYPVDINLRLEKTNPVRFAYGKIKAFLEVCDRYDVFHFNFGSSLIDFPYALLHHLDLPVLKRKGKKIFMTYQGCDARIRSDTIRRYKTSVCHHCRQWHCSVFADWVKRVRVRKVSRYADKIFALNPDLLDNLPGASLEFYSCVDLEEVKPIPFEASKTLRVVHAPSAPEIKGTAIVKKTVERLRADGFQVELDLVMNLPHHEAMRRYAGAHVAVDQLYAGWYGAFAVEAMALGKPVLCYLREEDLMRHVPFRNEIPIVPSDEDSLYGNLKMLMTRPALRRELGLKGRAYVEKFHNPVLIAKRMVEYYEGRELSV
ncbi:MAG: glycosyltransferase [Candidatus Omnitrophica bacterium]|nr:glycosyltransferase [Candidatus Omnitrophota bacterium]